jgi:hypothetical protein
MTACASCRAPGQGAVDSLARDAAPGGRKLSELLAVDCSMHAGMHAPDSARWYAAAAVTEQKRLSRQNHSHHLHPHHMVRMTHAGFLGGWAHSAKSDGCSWGAHKLCWEAVEVCVTPIGGDEVRWGGERWVKRFRGC